MHKETLFGVLSSILYIGTLTQRTPPLFKSKYQPAVQISPLAHLSPPGLLLVGERLPQTLLNGVKR